MDNDRDNKRKKERNDDNDDYTKERRQKKRRSRSKSPYKRQDRDSKRKRRHSRSKSPYVPAKQDKRRDDAPKDVRNKPEPPPRKAKETDMLNTRTGGAYIPPARLRMMQAQITDKSSVAYQRLSWEALKKSIHGHINKINVGNIGIIIKELLKENIVRGRGLLCRSVIQAQAASPTFTNVYAALVSAVNSRFPNIGELLLKRLVIQFKRGFKRNDKPICISSASFIAHLVNQKVAHEILALELLTLLVETPTDDSVEVAIAFLKECGQKLTEVSSKGVNAIFEMLRNILHEGQLDKRVQYMIEVMFQVWKDGFKDHPAVVEELELVPEEEQFTHLLMLDDATDSQDILNVFKFDENFEENEQKYKGLSKEILGSDAESGEEGGSGESGSEESDEEEEEEKEKAVTIIDNTETNLVALRRTIYLTINSSLDFEECAHKLMKMQLKPGQEIELCHMFLDCCAEQRTYEKFYGLLAQRFCNINRIYIGPFEEIFKDSYSTAHRLDTNRLRNVSKFFAHLLFTDSISWEALECVKLNEEDTTSSSRIYIKILFQELAEYMGLKKLNDRLKDPTLQEAFSGIFPRDNPKNTRFSINFFTSIGLGGLTDELREHLKQMPKNVPPQITEIKLDSDSDSDSSSSSSSDSSSSSSSDSSDSCSSEQENKKKDKKKKNSKPKTPEPQEANNKSKINERWGHDGFYDTYGKDSGIDSQTDRPNARSKEMDNFKRPRQDFRNGADHYDRNTRDDRGGNQRNLGRAESENDRRDTRRPDSNKNIRDEETFNRRRDEREYDDEYSRRRNDDRRDARNRDDNRRRKDYDRGYDRNRSNRYEQFQDKRNDREQDHREKKNESESGFMRRKPDQNDENQDSRYGDDRKNRENTEHLERGRDDRSKKERNDKERNSDQSGRDRSEKEASRKRQDLDEDSRRGREEEDIRLRRPDERNRNNDYNDMENSRSRVSSKQNDNDRRGNRHENVRNKHKNQDISDDEDERNQVSKSKKDKSNDERSRRKDKDSTPDKTSESSDEGEVRSKRRGKDKKKEKAEKEKLKEAKSKNKEKPKSDDTVTDNADTDNESSIQTKDKKSGKSKKRDKDKERQKDRGSNIENDWEESDEGQKDLGGRYWDNFDLESKNGSKEKFEGGTPDTRDINYERRRER